MTTAPLNPPREAFLKIAEPGKLVPIYTEFVADYETPVGVLEKIDDGRRSFLFESAEVNDHVGRYSILGSSPRVYFERRGRKMRIEERGKVQEFGTNSDPLAELRKLMDRYSFVDYPGLPPFVGGAVGYIGYDVVRFFEPTVTPSPPDQLNVADCVFIITDTFIVFDHRFRRLKIFAPAFIDERGPDAAYDEAGAKIAKIVERLQSPTQSRLMNAAQVAPHLSPQSNTSPEEFCDIVPRCQEHIRARDVFQTVPSQRFQAGYEGNPISLYRALRFVNPSPYMFYLRLGEKFSFIGRSPGCHLPPGDPECNLPPVTVNP